jgi:hypothetical protein
MEANMKTRVISLLCFTLSTIAWSPASAEVYWDAIYYYYYPYEHQPYGAYLGYAPIVSYAYQTPRKSPQRRAAQQRARAVQQQNSAIACDAYASNYARNASAQGDILAGGAFGSLAGLGIGALFAASGVGAAIGATAGIIGGGAVRNQREQQIYAAAYQDCMIGLAP